MQPASRIAWLDIAKGGSIICVALWHAGLYMVASGYHPVAVGFINDLLIPIRMPLFFAISGSLAARSLSRDWSALLRGSIWSFAYLFFLWSLVRWIYFRDVEPNVVNLDEGANWRQLLEMWLRPESGLWFIWALGIFFIVAKAGRRFRTPMLLMSFALAMLVWGGSIAPGNYAHANALKYLPFFLSGVYFGPRAIEVIAKRPIAIGSSSALTFAIMREGVLPRLGGGLDYGASYAVLAAAGLATGCAASVLTERLVPFGKALGYVGRNTLPIYVTHVLVISALVTPTSILGMTSPTANWFGAPLIVLVAILCPLALKTIVERSSLWWLYSAPALPA